MKNEKFNYYKKMFQNSSMFRSKRGINDISIIAVILSIFLLTAVIVPFINVEFGTNVASLDPDKIKQDLRNDAEKIPKSSAILGVSIGAFDVMKNIVKLAIHDFGDTLGLPFWLDLVYTLLAIIFILVIARNIWIGGGA